MVRPSNHGNGGCGPVLFETFQHHLEYKTNTSRCANLSWFENLTMTGCRDAIDKLIQQMRAFSVYLPDKLTEKGIGPGEPWTGKFGGVVFME